jgi:hypothetical protein
MSKQTTAQFLEALESCDFNSPDQVSKLVTATHTNVAFDEKVQERQLAKPVGAHNYFSGLFGTEVWPDGQGMDMVREYYTDPYIPFRFSDFVRAAAICDPNTADECRRDRCEIEEGGRGTMPPMVFFRRGLKTKRDCIANIRHIRQFKWWANKVIRSRDLADEQVMNIFYTMAALATSGHKIVLQGERDANNNLKLLVNNNPRNPLRRGLYNYMEEKFPQPHSIENIVPLEVESLEALARYWALFPAGNEVAKGPRNESIYEFWFPDDWYRDEAIRNPDYIEKLKIMMPAKLFAGYSLATTEREVIGNFAVRQMPMLPRFAPTMSGKIIPVDSHIGVDIEVGKEYVGALDFENAPIGLAMVVSGKQGTILSRPTLTESGAGFPIMPISGNGPWRIRNDYDKECNPDLNMPYSEKDYEMGYRLDNPDASVSFLFRRRVFNSKPINDCDLAPVFYVEDNESDCPISTVGCNNGKTRESDSIVGANGFKGVTCTAASCGNTVASPFTYIVKVDRTSNNPDFNSLNCECGSDVILFVYDSVGDYVKQIAGVVKDTSLGFPYARYFVETTTALAEGECIRGITCLPDSEISGFALDFWEDGDDLKVILDGALECEVGDDVVVTFYDAAGDAITPAIDPAALAEFDPQRFYYVITGVAIPEGAVRARVVCDA